VLKIISSEPADTKYQTLVLPQLKDELIRFNVIFRHDAEGDWLQLQPILPSFVFKTSATSLLDVTEVQVPVGALQKNKIIKINDHAFTVSEISSGEGSQLLGEITLQFKAPLLVQLGSEKTVMDLTAQTWQPSNVVLRAEKNDQSALMTAYLPVQKYVWRPNENTLVNCSFGKVGEIKRVGFGSGVEYQAKNRGAACDYLNMSELSLDTGLLLHIKGENMTGQSLKLYVRNLSTDKTELEYRLPQGKYDEVLTILPVEKTSEGLSLILETRSFGTEVSKNRVEVIELFAVPMRVLLSTAVQTNQDSLLKKQNIVLTNLYYFGSGVHVFTALAEQNGLVILSTSYDPLWLAFDVSHGRFLTHSQFSNWENAWEVKAGSSQLVLVYLPQILTWFSFMILIVVTMVIWKKSKIG
jgi:hypothetical protein